MPSEVMPTAVPAAEKGSPIVPGREDEKRKLQVGRRAPYMPAQHKAEKS
jgi:hypothetical protein